MKIFASEFTHNYKTYTFGYANYCIREAGDRLNNIYAAGYLPYSGSPGVKNIFYMARSARVPLRSFKLSSENRRVAKKFDGLLSRSSTLIEKFDVDAHAFREFCLKYFAQRHGPRVMPAERLTTILTASLITEIVSYALDGRAIAYVFEVSDRIMTHFWYSFYDLSFVHKSLGIWLMIDSARQAKERGAKYFYVGTVYGDKALYKTAFKNLEYWDGQSWVSGIKKLKDVSRFDDQRVVGAIDIWKNTRRIF